ncbi:hypothetical protein BDZ94DRAFT_1199167 [Collybia nuda]|uniref:NADH:flavin oxidoreductase/NADH oxidase N-terminal domain-containing protein n=1 Tax=Collybia nuda TaxID=64659 RepID=A0A9P5XZK7_9AGAR|nr:hypothetical protein BDZ94DRAFT_1199167 [Collybia nuda]
MGQGEIPDDGVFSPISLPCGRTVQNRLVKVAMYEHLADFHGGPPNDLHCQLYAKWAQYKWGMVFTGNVQVSSTHLTLGRDLVSPRVISKETLRPFEKLLESIRGPSNTNGTLAIMQLSHSGRQSANIIGGRLPFQRPLGPSSIRVKARNGGFLSDLIHGFAFQTPYEMSTADIDDVVEAFVRGAKVALEVGFDGIELHAAHGYLIAQFISPKSNTRSDEYSSRPGAALHLLHRIIIAIREVVPPGFVLGVKINAADYAESDEGASSNAASEQETRALNHVSTIASWGFVDFVEISGGDYEKPDFMTAEHPKSLRQALFARFSEKAVKTLEALPMDASSSLLPLILLTGGFRTSELLYTALSSKHAHLLGFGRAAVISPDLPELVRGVGPSHSSWSQPFRPEPDLSTDFYWPRWFWSRMPRIPLVGAGVGTAWYVVRMRQLAALDSKRLHLVSERSHDMGSLGALLWMWVWVDWRGAALLLSSLILITGLVTT